MSRKKGSLPTWSENWAVGPCSTTHDISGEGTAASFPVRGHVGLGSSAVVMASFLSCCAWETWKSDRAPDWSEWGLIYLLRDSLSQGSGNMFHHFWTDCNWGKKPLKIQWRTWQVPDLSQRANRPVIGYVNINPCESTFRSTEHYENAYYSLESVAKK